MSNEIVFLSNVRLSFPHLAEAHQSAPNAPLKFSGDFIMPPDHPGHKQFMDRVGQIALEKWNEHAGQVLQMINQDRKLRCYGNGNEKVNSKTFQVYDGYADMVYITANNDRMPQMIKADGSAVDPANTMEAQQLARTLYGGCYVNVALKPWPQDNKHGRGIRCDLVAVQFAGDGEAFGEESPDASGMFNQVASQPTAAGAPAAPVPGMPAAPAVPAPGMPGLPDFMGNS